MNGWIRTSRLTQGDGQVALYVAATDPNAGTSTIVQSFDVSDGMLMLKTQIDGDGDGQDILARSSDLDGTDVVASCEVTAGWSLFAVDRLLVAVHTELASNLSAPAAIVSHTEIQVIGSE